VFFTIVLIKENRSLGERGDSVSGVANLFCLVACFSTNAAETVVHDSVESRFRSEDFVEAAQEVSSFIPLLLAALVFGFALVPFSLGGHASVLLCPPPADILQDSLGGCDQCVRGGLCFHNVLSG
jgi:hypothetical protein